MKTVLFLFLGAVVVGGLALFGLFGGEVASQNQQGDSSEEVIEAEEKVVEPKTFTGLGTLEELQGLGENVECTISYASPELPEPVTGTYFVVGDNVRGDFELTVPQLGGTSLSSIILTSDMFYSWSEIAGQTYGVKMSVDSFSESESSDRQEPIPSDVDLTYNCVEWMNVDMSIFVPPSQVLFRDVGQLLQGGMEYGTIYEEGEF